MNIIRLTEIDREIRTAFPLRTPWFTFTLRCVGRVRIADRSFLRYAFFYFTCLPLLMIPVFLVCLRLLMMPRQYIYSMDKTVYIFSGQDSIYIQWTRQYIYSMDKTVYIFNGQDSIYIQWTRQYIYSVDKTVYIFNGQDSIYI